MAASVSSNLLHSGGNTVRGRGRHISPHIYNGTVLGKFKLPPTVFLHPKQASSSGGPDASGDKALVSLLGQGGRWAPLATQIKCDGTGWIQLI